MSEDVISWQALIQALGLIDLPVIFMGVVFLMLASLAFRVVSRIFRFFDEPHVMYHPKWYEEETYSNEDDETESPIFVAQYAPRRDPNHPRYD